MNTAPGAARESRELVLPVHANHRGTLFAGEALQMLVKAAFLAARDRAQREVVVAGVTGVDFLAPVPVGQELLLRAQVSRVGRCSMTVRVTALAQSPGAAACEVLRGVFEMVAVDDAGRPIVIDRTYQEQEAA